MRRRLKSFLIFTAITLPILAAAAVILLMEARKATRFDREIQAAAERYDLDPALIKAVIWQESRFEPDARGRAGEIGLMQVRDAAAWEWAEAEDIYPFEHELIADPAKNILAGSFYLAKVMKRYKETDNPVPYALADYNAGRSNVLRWNKGRARTNSAAFLARIDFPSTREYALTVMKRYAYYKKRFRW